MLIDSNVISLQISTADITQQIVWIGSSSIRTVRTFVPEPGIPGILGVRITKAYFMSCHSNTLTYHQTLERSVRYFEYALPEKPVKIAALSTTPEACPETTNASTITLLLSQQQLHLLLVNRILLLHLAQLLSPTRTGPRPRASIPQSRPSQ